MISKLLSAVGLFHSYQDATNSSDLQRREEKSSDNEAVKNKVVDAAINTVNMLIIAAIGLGIWYAKLTVFAKGEKGDIHKTMEFLINKFLSTAKSILRLLLVGSGIVIAAKTAINRRNESISPAAINLPSIDKEISTPIVTPITSNPLMITSTERPPSPA